MRGEVRGEGGSLSSQGPPAKRNTLSPVGSLRHGNAITDSVVGASTPSHVAVIVDGRPTHTLKDDAHVHIHLDFKVWSG